MPTVRKFDQAVLEQPAFVATDGDFGVYTRWIEEEFLPSVDVRTLADGKPGRRAAAPEPVESWVEVDGKRVRLGLPASLASVAALGAGLAGLAGAGATGDPALTSDSGESVHPSPAERLSKVRSSRIGHADRRKLGYRKHPRHPYRIDHHRHGRPLARR